MMLAEDMMKATAHECERIQKELADGSCDGELWTIVRTAQSYSKALFRVEFDFCDNPDDPQSPYSASWLYAHRMMWQNVMGERHDFSHYCDEGMRLWHEQHPEWKQQQAEKRAAEDGRLF